MILINGGVYERPYISVFALIYIGLKPVGDKRESCWGMLHIYRHQVSDMSCPMFQHNKYGSFSFTEQELRDEFNLDKWKFLDGRLRIEKIENCPADYPFGELVEYTKEKIAELSEQCINTNKAKETDNG